MQQIVVLMRHARTSWNEQGRFNSTVDIGLDSEGTRQATVTAAELARLAPFAFVRSDARGARETAAPLERRIERSPEEPRLAEVDFGPFERRRPDELIEDPDFVTGQGGGRIAGADAERLEAAADRACAGLSDVIARHWLEPTIVVVSHGVLLRVLLCRIVLKLPATEYRRLRLYNARAAVLSVGDDGPHHLLAGPNVSPSDLANLLAA
jgi:broad specificity phosphatase PhoE